MAFDPKDSHAVELAWEAFSEGDQVSWRWRLSEEPDADPELWLGTVVKAGQRPTILWDAQKSSESLRPPYKARARLVDGVEYEIPRLAAKKPKKRARSSEPVAPATTTANFDPIVMASAIAATLSHLLPKDSSTEPPTTNSQRSYMSRLCDGYWVVTSPPREARVYYPHIWVEAFETSGESSLAEWRFLIGERLSFLTGASRVQANSLKRLFEAWVRSTARIAPESRDWESVFELGHGLLELLITIMITEGAGLAAAEKWMSASQTMFSRRSIEWPVWTLPHKAELCGVGSKNPKKGPKGPKRLYRNYGNPRRGLSNKDPHQQQFQQQLPAQPQQNFQPPAAQFSRTQLGTRQP